MDFVIFPSRSLCPRMEIECPACLPACVVGAKYTMWPRNKQYVYAFVLDGTEKAPGDRLPDAGQRVSPTQCRLPDAPCLPLPWRPTGRAERVGVDREEQRGPSWRIGCPRHMAPDHMPARPCRLEERSRCVRAHVPHFVPPLQFGKLRRCAYSPRHARLSRAHLPSAQYIVIGLSDRLHHLLARGLHLVQPGPLLALSRPTRSARASAVAAACSAACASASCSCICKDLFSPICTSIGLIRPDFPPDRRALRPMRHALPRDSKVGRSATRRMAGLVGFRVGIAQS